MSYSLKQLARDKGFSEALLRSYGVRDGLFNGTPRVEIGYHNADGTLHPRFQIRTAPEKAWFWNEGPEPPITIYGAHFPVPITSGDLFVVEGPSDCWTLWEAGYPAIGIPGATSTKHLHAVHLHGVTIICVIKEPGIAGEAFPGRIAARAWNIGFQGDVLTLAMPDGVKDPRDLRQSVGADKFREKFAEAILNGTCIERPPAPEQVENGSADRQPRSPSQDDVLIGLVEKYEFELVPGIDKKAYARVPINDTVKALYQVCSPEMEDYLASRYFRMCRRGVDPQAMKKALSSIKARTLYDTDVQPVEVALRVSAGRYRVHLDLGDDAWNEVEITPEGWRVCPHQVHFWRTDDMMALPIPQRGERLSLLRKHVNFEGKENDGASAMLLSWLLHTIAIPGPYHILHVVAERGAGKTMTARMVRSIVDPSTVLLSGLPRKVGDLVAAASGSHILGFDNLGKIDRDQSDWLCQISTGMGVRQRTLHTNLGRTIVQMRCPIILTSIGEVIRQPDLAQRIMRLPLPPLPKQKIRTEDELWAEFKADHPFILGALLDAAVLALRNRDETRRTRPYAARMMDYVEIAIAAEDAYDVPAGTLAQTHGAMQSDADSGMLEEPLPRAVMMLINEHTEGAWEAPAAILLKELGRLSGVDKEQHVPDHWPGGPQALSGALREFMPALRSVGIEIKLVRHGGPDGKTRTVRITRTKTTASVDGAGDGGRGIPNGQTPTLGKNIAGSAGMPEILI